MLAWRHLYIVSQLLLMGSVANADDGDADCGKVLGGPIHSDTIYVLCPSLSELSEPSDVPVASYNMKMRRWRP